MAKLYETTRIKSMVLPNRFVRSATWEGMAENDGSCSARLLDLTARLARGGVGLIITGHAYVSPEGQAGPWQIGVHTDGMVRGLGKLAEEAHRAGGKVALQLAHAGCYAPTALTGRKAV